MGSLGLIIVGSVLSLGPFAARTVRECVAPMQCVRVFGDAFCVWEWFVSCLIWNARMADSLVSDSNPSHITSRVNYNSLVKSHFYQGLYFGLGAICLRFWASA